MPAKNPRLTITLQPTLAAQLRRLSELTGNSQSALIAELLEGSTPVFDRMIAVLEAAHSAKDAMRGKVAADLEKGQAALEKQLGLALDTFDTHAAPLLEHFEDIKRRAAPGVGMRSTPHLVQAGPKARKTPPSNRGVRSPDKTPKTRAKSRR